MCVCVRARARACVCVCVCVRGAVVVLTSFVRFSNPVRAAERERERERESLNNTTISSLLLQHTQRSTISIDLHVVAYFKQQ